MQYEHIETLNDTEFIDKAVIVIEGKITQAVQDHNQCIIGLAGGSTPKPVYEALGKKDLDWSKIFLFLDDERHVPADHSDSNQKLVRDTLLAHADVPESNLYFPDTSLSIDDCVIAYSEALIHLLKKQPPDLMILGMGNDGHITSLFPPVTEEAFGEVLVIHTTTDTFAIHDRISASPLVIMASQAHVLLLKGEEKKKVFEECVKAEMNPVRWPLHIALATKHLTAILQL